MLFTREGNVSFSDSERRDLDAGTIRCLVCKICNVRVVTILIAHRTFPRVYRDIRHVKMLLREFLSG